MRMTKFGKYPYFYREFFGNFFQFQMQVSFFGNFFGIFFYRKRKGLHTGRSKPFLICLAGGLAQGVSPPLPQNNTDYSNVNK